MMPPAVLVAGLAVWLVPQSRNGIAVPIDVPGLATSTAALGALVWTIIEAPRVGWISPQTSIGLALSAALWPVLVLVERRRAHPLISPTLLTNRRFTAASVAVAISFFCLFGFMFMIAQYGAYAFWRTHLRVLLRAADIPDPDDALAEVLLALLAGEFYRHLRDRGLHQSQLLATLTALAARTLGGGTTQRSVSPKPAEVLQPD